MSQFHTLQVGHAISWEGDLCIVGAASEHCARIILPNGLTDIVPNPIKSYFHEPCRGVPPCNNGCLELENLLACFAGKRDELTKPISKEENESMSTTAKKSTAYLTKPRGGLAAQKKATEGKTSSAKPKSSTLDSKGAATPKPAKVARVKADRPTSYAGISDFIGGLAIAGKNHDEIKVATIVKYPGATPAWIVKVADKRKAKAEAAAKKAAAKTEAKPEAK